LENKISKKILIDFPKIFGLFKPKKFEKIFECWCPTEGLPIVFVGLYDQNSYIL
jgi:hypothetical protein